MTQIAFHFGAPDRLQYACRLLRKIAAAGKSAVVWGEQPALSVLDTGLWAVSPTDFVTHAVAGAAPASLTQRSAIVFTSELLAERSRRDVLVNLHPQLPQGYDTFERVIEVVSAQGEDRESARTKWRQYTAAGHNIVRHDLQLKEGST